jgi:hypothetical protein
VEPKHRDRARRRNPDQCPHHPRQDRPSRSTERGNLDPLTRSVADAQPHQPRRPAYSGGPSMRKAVAKGSRGSGSRAGEQTAASGGLWAALLSSNQGRDASVVIRPRPQPRRSVLEGGRPLRSREIRARSKRCCSCPRGRFPRDRQDSQTDAANRHAAGTGAPAQRPHPPRTTPSGTETDQNPARPSWAQESEWPTRRRAAPSHPRFDASSQSARRGLAASRNAPANDQGVGDRLLVAI